MCFISVLRTATWRSRGNLPKHGWEGFQEPEGWRKPKEHNPQNQIRKASRGSQRLKWKLQSLYGSEWSPLLIPYGCRAGCSHEIPNSGSLLCFWLFCLLVGLFYSYWVAMFSFDMRICAWFHCILLCCVWWYAWETCSFLLLLLVFWGVRSLSGGEGQSGRTNEKSGGRENWDPDVISEKRIKDKNKELHIWLWLVSSEVTFQRFQKKLH